MSQGQPQRYRVIEKLASGGMAEVFRAESAGIEGFKKKVAIKRVLPHLGRKQKFISMFLDEARLSAHLSHSNVVQVFDIGMGDDTYFIVMEFVDGADLKAIAETRRKHGREFPLEEAVYIATRTCDGLTYAHELTDQDGRPIGIVHRDMSPPNVLITKFGEVKIADFGLAKATTQLEKSEPGIIKGKFAYLSPEAAMGQEVDERADIFAVGVILWELLAGRRLFAGESDYQTVKLVQQANVPAPSTLNPRVPPELDRVILRALTRDPDARYRRARELAQDLNAFLFHHGRPVGPWDIADLVLETMDARRRDRPAGPSIIEKLIQDTLFEFTSLRGNEPSEVGSGAAASAHADPSMPLRLDELGRMRDWGADIVLKTPDEPRRHAAQPNVIDSSLPPAVFEEGNLAALEEMPGEVVPPPPASGPVSARPSGPASSPPSAHGQVPSSARPGPGAALDLERIAAESAPAKRSSAATIAIVVLLVAAAAVAGAWYANLIPH
jgi:serine/threonine-protein kinase